MLQRERAARLSERGEEVLKRVLPPVVLFTIAFAVRVLPWPTVVGESRVVFFGMDAWYHMRRVLFALANRSAPLTFDPYVNFPHGAKPIWPPLFDGLTALLLSPVYALGAWRHVELAAALLPPVLGGLCVVATWHVARRLFPAPVPLLAGLLLCFLSGHFWYAQAGFLDHHAAVALFVTLLLASTTALLLPRDSGAPGLREAWPRYTGFGVTSAFALLLWPGAVLHVGLAVLGLLFFTASRRERTDAARVAVGSLFAYAVAFLLLLPFGLTSSWPQWGEFSPVVLSRFQPWMFAGLGLQAAVCAFLWQRTSLGVSRRGRVAQGLAVGILLLGASALAYPALVEGARDAWGWLGKEEIFQGLVSESKPLFESDDGFDPANALLRLSRFVWLFPVAAAALLWRALRSPQRSALLLLVGYAVALAAATLLQRRFFNSFSPVFAIVSAWAVVEAVRALPPPMRATPGRAFAVAMVCGAAGVWLVAPTLEAYRRPLENLAQLVRGESLTLPRAELGRRRMLEAAVWLRENTPPTSGYLDPGASPEYGVLAPWGYGHLLKYVAQRPTVVGNFGDDVGERNLRRTEAYFRSGEPDASRILDDLQARYVVVETLAAAGPRQRARDAMRSRLSVDDSPGLARHRLLWESPLGPSPQAPPSSELRIFEYVRGAAVGGDARPGAQVRALLRYESNRGRRGVYETTVLADEDGRYLLRLPYATKGATAGVATDNAYVLRADGRTARLAISERAVLDGLTVEGPGFAAE